MPTNCDNCCCSEDSELLFHDAITVKCGSPSDAVTRTTRLPITDALTSICCTLWGDPISALKDDHQQPDHVLELCSNCTETLTQLYNVLLEFRHLCREKGKVFARLLELRKIRRQQETVVAVVKLERLSTSQHSLRPRRNCTLAHEEDDDEDGIISTESNDALTDELDEFKIKEEPEDEDDNEEQSSDWNFIPFVDDGNFSSGGSGASSDDDSDEEFVIRPRKDPLSLNEDRQGTGNFECNICYKRFAQTCGLSRHVRQKHGDEESPIRYSCPEEDCKKSYTRMEHVRKHLKDQHPTAIASPSFLNATKDQRNKGTGNFECNICQNRFANMAGLSRHVELKHGESSFHSYPCPIEDCEKSYARRDNLVQHVKIQHPTATVSFERKQRKKKKTETIKAKKKETIKAKKKECQPPKKRVKSKKACPHCQKLYRVDHLREHILTHSNERPHLCDHCGATYKAKKALREHIMEKHTKERVFQCPRPSCNVICTRATSLKLHIKRIHDITSDSICTCEVCGKQFVHESNLKVHQKIHQQDRVSQFTCHICGKILSRADNLRVHMKNCHVVVESGLTGQSTNNKNRNSTGLKRNRKKLTAKGPSRNTVAKVLSKNNNSTTGLVEDQPQQQQHQSHHDDEHNVHNDHQSSYQMTNNFVFN